MAVEKSEWSQMPTIIPPRTLNVQKFAESRASELETLHSIVANRVGNDFRSQRNKRRRTTGHDNRLTKKKSRKRRKLGLIDKIESSDGNKDQKKVSRRVLRRIGLTSNPERGFCTSGDGTKRLRTHLWHAKRFSMTKQWGFYLPRGLQGGGRGSRALLKWFKRGSLIHDASYICAVQLEGPEDSLLSILRMVLVPTPSVCFEELPSSVLSGVSYGSAMLHHVGAPFSQLIAPVTYMWRPLTRGINVEYENVSSAGGTKPSCSVGCISPFRQLWMWIHAAAFNEGYDALKCASQKQMDESHEIIKCFQLEGQLAKLEVLGSKAIQVLQKIIHPLSETSEASFRLTKRTYLEDSTDTQINKSFILEHFGHLPPGAILSLTVKDPRDVPKKDKTVSEAESTVIEDDVQENNSDGFGALTETLDKNKDIVSLLWSKAEASNVLLSDNQDLWDIQNVLIPPLEENLLCAEKHQRRMELFCMDSTQSEAKIYETTKQSTRSCPILLLKDSNQNCSVSRFSIVLPLSWVKAFWVPLVSSGARAIGFREKHQIACDIGWPSFPFDFPDCKAYSSLMANEAVMFDQQVELRPPAMRPPRVPIQPQWGSVRLSFEQGVSSNGDIQPSPQKIRCGPNIETGSADTLVTSELRRHDSQEQDNSSFDGVIFRASIALTNYLREIRGHQSLSFPNLGPKKKDFSRFLNDEVKDNQRSEISNQILVDRKLCFVRVHLRAFKEGVFEDGAVVCAPRLSDIALWLSRSDAEEGGLQIPQSSITSIFTQQPSGKWEISKPEDPSTREAHRWSIGFVTTGFVRGSIKPVAEGFCEASLLDELRREQWTAGVKSKQEKEIFVLVRNLKSAAYRLALASIILEQQEQDLDFM